MTLHINSENRYPKVLFEVKDFVKTGKFNYWVIQLYQNDTINVYVKQTGQGGDFYLFQYDAFIVYAESYVYGASPQIGLALIFKEYQQEIDFEYKVPVTDRYAFMVVDHEKIDLLRVTLLQAGEEREFKRFMESTSISINYLNSQIENIINLTNLNFIIRLGLTITLISAIISYIVVKIKERK
jgi:hypothetical protein